MNPENLPLIIILAGGGITGIFIGVIIGWVSRSLFVCRDIQRAARDAWSQARIINRHNGSL